MNASLIGAGLIGHGVVSLGMVDGLSVSRRRLWQSARQHRVRGVITQPGAVGKTPRELVRDLRIAQPKAWRLIGRMNKNRDGESNFSIGQSLSDYCRAARPDKAGRRGGVVCLLRCVAPK